MKGPTRSAASIVFGLFIDNEVAREWFKNAYKYELCSDHSEDLSITMQLKKLVIENCLWVLRGPTKAGIPCERLPRHHAIAS